MARETRAAARNRVLGSAHEDAAAVEHLSTLVSAENPDGTPFVLPVEGVAGGTAQTVDVSDRVARVLGIARTVRGTLTPTGYAQPAVNGNAGAAVTLTVPANSRIALIIPSVAVRWRDDGTAPTGTVGMPLAAGVTLEYDGDLAAIQFIAQGAGAGVLDVSFYT